MPTEIDVATLASRLAGRLPTRLLDVREPWEFDRARIPGSVNVPLGELREQLEDLLGDPETLTVTICHHGIRSLQAAVVLERAGLRAVCSLAGGVDRWAARVDPTMPRY